jgi:hypothetical protein
LNFGGCHFATSIELIQLSISDFSHLTARADMALRRGKLPAFSYRNIVERESPVICRTSLKGSNCILYCLCLLGTGHNLVQVVAGLTNENIIVFRGCFYD